MKNTKSNILGSLQRSFQLAQLKKKDEKVYYNFVHQKTGTLGRRKFISKTAIATIGLSMPTLMFQGCKKNQPIISIIGGGIAGLSCANSLQKGGVFANVYEASSRIGGRIHTLSDYFSQGMATELGGEFINTDHFDMIRLANEFNLNLIDRDEDYSINEDINESYYVDGNHIKEDEFVEAFAAIADKINKDRRLCGKAYDTPHAKLLDNTSLEEYVDQLACEPFLKTLIINAYTSEFGLDAGLQSSLILIKFTNTTDIEGSKFWGDGNTRFKIKGGNIQLIDKLAKSLEDNIHLESKLVSVNTNGHKYNLVFDNGKEVLSDFVVMAMPFTVLRNIELNIDGITNEKLKCIKELGYGQNNKLILGYNGRPWRENGYNSTGSLIGDPIQMAWDSSHMLNHNSGESGYTIFLGGTPSLELAAEAKRLGLKNKISLETTNYFVSQLNSIFSNSKEQFNGKHYTAMWTNNPLSKGSYACYKTGQFTTIAGHEMSPIKNVFFAGEHCSRNFQGFMNGGAETGRRVAEAIYKKI